MGYRVLIDRRALEYVDSLPPKSRRIVRERLRGLGEDPYPGQGGDKEKLIRRGRSLYRLHIARSFTAFYRVYDSTKEVRILKVMTIDMAHKEYGRP
jgi:mRNA-degrading endonuclease RelE of RelBE toxin-antitoxin system